MSYTREMRQADQVEAYRKYRVDSMTVDNGVRVVEASAGTGTRFVVIGTPIPLAAQPILGGGEILVSVYGPWPTVYPVQSTGFFHYDYAREKFAQGVTHGGDEMGLLLAVADAAGRTLSGLPFVES